MIIAIGTRVRFKEHVYTDLAPYYDDYKGHEFVVSGYMPDEGIEFTLDDGYIGCRSVLDGKPFKNKGFVYDNIRLKCLTGNVKVKGFVHDCDLEIVE